MTTARTKSVGMSGEKSRGKSGRTTRRAPIPQPHGGALVPGAGCGPAPGAPNAGRPPSAVRSLLRESFAARIPLAEAIADDAGQSAADRLRALDLLARYGVGAARDITVEEVRDRLARTIATVRAAVPPELADPLLTRLREIWT